MLKIKFAHLGLIPFLTMGCAHDPMATSVNDYHSMSCAQLEKENEIVTRHQLKTYESESKNSFFYLFSAILEGVAQGKGKLDSAQQLRQTREDTSNTNTTSQMDDEARINLLRELKIKNNCP